MTKTFKKLPTVYKTRDAAQAVADVFKTAGIRARVVTNLPSMNDLDFTGSTYSVEIIPAK